MDGLTVGRNVHYVTGSDEEVHLLALVVKVWDKDSGMVNLTVFNDWVDRGDVPCWSQTSVPYSETLEPFTWHWIEKA